MQDAFKDSVGGAGSKGQIERDPLIWTGYVLGRWPPRGLACNNVPAPMPAEGISWCVSQDLCAGEITVTSGFSFSDTPFADMELLAGRVGNAFCSSSSLNPVPTSDGMGGNESTTTTAVEFNIPLTVSSVVSSEVHSCLVRGGSPRIATRRTIATRQSSGNTNINGDSVHFAHPGTDLQAQGT